MKKTKKIALMLMTVVLMAVCCVFGASAFKEGVYTYTVTGGEATIVKVDIINDNEVIPETLGGYPVVSFGKIYQHSSNLMSIIIPATVKTIEAGAFEYCSSLENFVVDSDNEYFSSLDGVLYNKNQTILIHYPNGNKRTTYRVPDGVIILQDMMHCKYLVDLILPDSVESFGSFAGSTKLKVLTMTNSVKSIKNNAFFSTYLDRIYFVGTEAEWSSLEENYQDTTGTPYLRLTKKVFVNDTHLKNVESIIVNPTCTTEGIKTTNCLCGCGYTFSEKIPVLDEHPYTKIIIEPTCTSRGYEKYVCSSCGDTYTINYTPMLEHDYKDVFTVEPTCVSNGRKNIICSTCGYCKSSNVYVPSLGHIDENKDLYCDRENCKEAIESEPFTEGIYTYTVKAGAATIKSVDTSISGDVVIPSTLGGYPVVAIGGDALVSPFITSVTIPEGVTSIGEFAFAMCVKLNSITLPDTLTEIGNGAFGWCLSLKEIILPERIEILNDQIFYGCFSLERLVIKNPDIDMNEDVLPCYTSIEFINITKEEVVARISEAYELYLAGDTEGYDKIMDDINNHLIEIETPKLLPLTIYSHDPSTAKTYAEENGIPFKNISELEETHTCSFGEWFTETEPTVFSEGVLKRICECGEFETKPIAKLESAVTKDETTNVEITYTEENFETEVSLVVSEDAVNADIVFGDEYENYKAFDISIEANGEKVQPNGKVTVKLPLPEGFDAETTKVYYVDENGNKEEIESTTENGYIIFETDHFSEYVLVDESTKHEHSYTGTVTKAPTCTEQGTKTFTCSCGDSYTESIPSTGHSHNKVVTAPTCTAKGYTTYTCSCGDSYVADYVNALGHKDDNGDYKCDNGCGYEYEKPAEPEVPSDPSENCSCNCHKGGFMGFIWKIINFFQKLFKANPVCACGAAHY